MNERKPIEAGVVGVGYAGSLHTAKYAGLPGARLVAVADIDERRAREAGELYQVPGVTDYRDLLDKVRCVSIAVPTGQHYRVARDFLEAGIDVLVEKPITSTVADGRKLVDLARKKGCILQVGHLERFNPVVRELSQFIEAPKFVECHRLAPFVTRGTDVDVVLDLMIHDIDIIASLVRAPVAAIDANGVAVITDKPDIANARIRFDDGCVANVTASRVSMKRERKIRFFQSDTYISLDYDAKTAEVYRMEDRSQGWAGIRGQMIATENGDALRDQIESFLESVATRKEPVVSGEDGLHALQIASAISERL
ncbi:MAG: Gfo/Idh/MocA family oxidoreductase [Deltaproteobacteria bacterium]|nr:Gfo/Idh/MocA family oxidoreductase [Deltaproteobacteria bacterium]